ncbi:MAG: chorismate lyase [Rhodocyclaceae bacterium]
MEHLRRNRWLQRLPRPHGSDPYYHWLVHVGSLTARLRQCCDEFRVVVLRQRLELPSEDEQPGLSLRRGEVAWVREVLLLCGGRPVVFAHSVLPRRCVRGGWHLLAGLGARPLGAILFSDPRIRRLPFAFQKLDSRDPLYHRAEAAARDFGGAVPSELWARRSLFCRGGRPILVTEAFLPDILLLNP